MPRALRNGPLRHGCIVPTGNRVRLDGSPLVRRRASSRGFGREQISSVRGLDEGSSARHMKMALLPSSYSCALSSYSYSFSASFWFLSSTSCSLFPACSSASHFLFLFFFLPLLIYASFSTPRVPPLYVSIPFLPLPPPTSRFPFSSWFYSSSSSFFFSCPFFLSLHFLWLNKIFHGHGRAKNIQYHYS